MYDIRVDTAKNRVYLLLAGYFGSQEAQEGIDAFKAALDQLQPGFDVITDLRNFKPASRRVAESLAAVHQYEIERGMNCIVRIVDKRTLGAMQFERISKQTGVTVLGATSLAKAETLLDRQIA